VVVLFALGLMSKPMLVSLPAVLLLVDYWPLKRPVRFGRLVIEKIPLMLMSLGISVFAVVAQREAGAMRTLSQFSLGFRVSNAIVSYARYVLKTFWPSKLAVFYPPPEQWSALAVIGAAALLIAITIVAIYYRRRSPYLLMGWLWFGGMLLPV